MMNDGAYPRTMRNNMRGLDNALIQYSYYETSYTNFGALSYCTLQAAVNKSCN
jgi:hypothetical protein